MKALNLIGLILITAVLTQCSIEALLGSMTIQARLNGSMIERTVHTFGTQNAVHNEYRRVFQ